MEEEHFVEQLLGHLSFMPSLMQTQKLFKSFKGPILGRLYYT